MPRAQVAEDVVDQGAAMRVEIVLAQQNVEAVESRLAPIAGVLDGVDAIEVARKADGIQDAAHVLPRRIGKDELHAAQAGKRVFQRIFVQHDVGELGKHVRLGEEAPGVHAVVAHEAVQRRAVALPELLAHAVGARLVQAELAHGDLVDLHVHRREDGGRRVVQRVIEVEDPHAPGRREACDSHNYLLLMSVPTPWSVRTSSNRALGTRPSMIWTLCTPLRAASSAEPILGSMPPEITPFATSSSILRGVSPVRSLPSLSSTPGVLVSTTSFSARSTSASFPATRSALML